MHQDDERYLDALVRDAVGYFLRAVNPDNGLIADSSRSGSPCSIAATGLGLTVYPVAVERTLMTRDDAVARTLAALRFFRSSEQSDDAFATGYKGFYYHFLDMQSGRRVWECELSTIDTAILVAGMLTSRAYFTGASDDEREIREIATLLYERVDWPWATNGDTLVRMGWRPATGFLSYAWEGYSEALLLYILGLGSTDHPLQPTAVRELQQRYQWENLYDIDHVFAGPLFIHQLPHVWLDLRGIRDAFMRAKQSDYFENSRRATLIQQHYALHNPLSFAGYGANCWGITAGLGPGDFAQRIDGGLRRQFYGYVARGVPFGLDDGTIAPWAVAASMPFAPEVVMRSLRGMEAMYPAARTADGLLNSFNTTFDPMHVMTSSTTSSTTTSMTSSNEGAGAIWSAPEQYGLDQGPVAIMLENHRSGLLWHCLRACPSIVRGLERAGFRGGWLPRR